MIELGDTVVDTENRQRLVVGKTVTLEAVERLPKRFVVDIAKPVVKKEKVEAKVKAKKEKKKAKK